MRPPDSNLRALTRVETTILALIIVPVAFILHALLFPAVTGGEPSSVAQARDGVTQLVTACIAFETEYGYFPGTGHQAVSGDLLAALLASNKALNPLGILFIDLSPYRRKKGGITNGTYLDPWGIPYQIAFADGTNTSVRAGTNNQPVPKRVAVWTDPTQPLPPELNTASSKSRRYITSWN